MNSLTRHLRNISLAVTACTVIAHTSAFAQTYPDRPVTLIVPYAPGTLVDILARTVGNDLAVILKQPVIVDNRPGAGQVVAASYVARAAPNGYTLMITAMPTVTTPSIQKTLPYTGNTDFTAIAHVSYTAPLLVVSSKLPVSNVNEFIALLKANPGKYSFMSAGIGSPIHLYAEMFNKEAGVKAVHIPYKSFQVGLTDIMAGQVDYGFHTLGSMQHVATGKLKAMGLSSLKRDPGYPDVPTLDEQGLKGFQTLVHYFIVGPKGMPPEIVARLNTAINSVVSSDAYLAKIKPIGGVSPISPPLTAAQTAALNASEDDRWLKLVKEQNIALE